MLFGAIGDIYDNSMITMSVATLSIGLLPNYYSIGYLAPTLLFILRFVQGLCVGGECNGITIYLFEANYSSKSYLSSIVTASSMLGALLAIIIRTIKS
jgi:MHS family proline/betaine transporter-like MFS transporter